jgi:hypothetical protein
MTRADQRTGPTKDGEPYTAPTMMCRRCGSKLDQVIYVDEGKEYHYTCEPQYIDDKSKNDELKRQLVKIIRWNDDNSPRSLQMAIGPSEMGSPCDQRIARILAGMPRVNFRPDPWAAIVGTSIHNWMESALIRYQKEVNDPDVADWIAEQALQVDDMIPAHTDLWNGIDVIDYKSAGPDVMRKMQKHGPPDGYKIQVHTYAKARERLGQEIRDVVLVFLPRAGWIKDMYIWREPYNPEIADNALARVYEVGMTAIGLGVLDDPSKWAQIPTEPTDCWYCPFFVDRPAEQLPDAFGCPGNNPPQAQREEAAVAKFEKGLI